MAMAAASAGVSAAAAAAIAARRVLTEEGHQVTILDSGLRVATEAVPGVRSVALGLWVGTGSRDETPAQAGLSHFLEHLLFKGTENHSAVQIAETFDGLGASVNAATSKETTHLHARFLDTHTEEAFALLAEMLLGPTYPDIDSERQVVLEEIAMYEDEPMDRVHDVLGAAIFGEHQLGRRVLGEAEVIASVPIPEISAYHRARYTAPNVVVAAAGHVDHDEIVRLSEKLLTEAGGEAPASDYGDVPVGEPRVEFYPKETEQYHVCFGGPGITRNDERRFALGILDAIFGGSTSSRLFQEVREKRGLAYSVASYTDQHRDAGVVAMYVGTREDNVEEACQVIGAELSKLHNEPVSDEELTRAKEHVKGRLVLTLESTAARMSRLGRSLLFDTPIYTLDELIERVDAVTIDDVSALAQELYDPTKLSAACVGTDENRFLNALPSSFRAERPQAA
jgi:predicted Zn-dependent peptidase